jgi:phenylpyruvate tautomerase PptA (4-oxalocrotonate tautomerase family)
MPFIHIQSLPMPEDKDPAAALERIAGQFSRQTGIEQRHVTVTWQYFQPQHYVRGKWSGPCFDPQRHQVLVDLLVPDFNDAAAVERMMQSIASALEEILQLPQASVFIHTRHAASGMVMDVGEIVRW